MRRDAGLACCRCVLGTILLAAPSWALEGDTKRVLAALFQGSHGAVVGDVTADGITGAADVTGTIGGLRNPTWPGPYRVGVRTVPLVKNSETTGEARRLDTLIWYPTTSTRFVNPQLGGIPSAEVHDGLGRMPLILFSHGSCGIPGQSVFLTAQLASYGFIVAAPPHPGNRLLDVGCGTTAAVVDSFQNRVADIRFVIDALLAEDQTQSSPFFERVDAAHVGMSGHSFGGQTALRVAALDERVLASLALAPAIGGISDVPSQILIPTMIQGGSDDSVTPFPSNQQVPYEDLNPPKYLVEIERTGHFAFSDLCPTGPECSGEALDPEEAHAYVVRFAIPFLLGWVGNDPTFEIFLDPRATPQGARFSVDLG